MNKVRVAARAVESEGFLLAEDAAVIVNAAAESPAVAQKAQGISPR
ncbi:hypothetical protein [Methylobacterium sp. J-076]|nr:hypothetical protein [Methylobacterium sp. J-076]MCJ2010960.1 hypothetical protein [Methylobacterium sp. J-076]